MKITNTAITYRTTIVVLTLMLTIGGLVSYLTIPKESNPSIEIPNIIVTTIYPGASPNDIESTVTQVLEQEIEGISGIDEVRSTSTEGVSTIVVEFTPDVEMDKAYQEVRDQVDIAKPELPDEVEEPIVSEIDISDFPISTVNLSADYSLARLKQVAEDLQEEIESIPSVLEATLVGGLEREVQVQVDLNTLKGYNLTFSELVQTIQSENTNIPGGSIDVDRLNYLVRVDGKFDDPERIRNLVVKAPAGNPIYVRDVAEVEFGFKDRETYSRLSVMKEETENGDLVVLSDSAQAIQQVVSLNIKKRSGDNILEAAAEVERVIEEFNFPSGTQVTVTGDQSENVESLVNDLENNIISGLIFVVAVLLFFLGVRNAVLVGIAIPLSMFTSFLVFSAMGQTLNFIILFSLIIALGMLVDNAIVIVENIYRFKEEGYSRWEAAKEATAEVGGPVVGATLTTVFAFAPMMLWPGIIGEFMSYMPLTLIITLTSSLFVALVINPVITGFFVKVEGQDDSESDGGIKSWPRGLRWGLTGLIVLLTVVLLIANWKTVLVLGVSIPLLYFAHTRLFKPAGDRFVETGLPRIIDRYRTFLEWMLERDYSGERALLRNTWSLAALAVAAVVLIFGALINAAFGMGAASLLLVPGGLLLVAGLLGVLFHTLEALFVGGRATMWAGAVMTVVMAVIAGLVVFIKSLPLTLFFQLIAPTVLVILVGAAGYLHRKRPGTARLVDSVLLILTGASLVGVVIGILSLTGLLGPSIPGRGLLGLLAPAALFGAVAFLGRSHKKAPDTSHLFLTDNRALLLNGSLGTLITIVLLFAANAAAPAFFPETDPSQVRITLSAPIGTNVETSNAIAKEAYDRIQRLLAENPEVEANVQNVLVNVGVSSDSDFGGGAASSDKSRITLNLVDFAERAQPSTETLELLRSQLQGLPGVEVEFTKDQQGPPTGPPVNIEITGPEFDRIVQIAAEMKQRLERGAASGEIDGLVDISDNLNRGRPEVQVDIDRERAGRFGLTTMQIAQTVRAAINGIEAGKYRDGEDEYEIMVRLKEEDRASIESLSNLTILNEGRQIPLVSVADVEMGSGFGSITRKDLERVVTVQGDAAPGYNGQEVLREVQTYLEEYQQELPSGYALRYTGGNEEQQESFGFLTTALLIGIALISVVLIAQFNSISAPFIIMVAVGLSLTGVLLGLIITQTAFGLFTFIGIISLAGIVVNNNIVLIDYVMQLRMRGYGKQEAIVEGGATRLRPVLLTALTTILGLIPLTFGLNIDFVGLLANLEPNLQFGSENTQFWGPMGTAIISGLTFATFLTLVIVPVMYSAFDSVGVRFAHYLGRDATDGSLVSESPVLAGDGAGSPQGEPAGEAPRPLG